MEVKTNAHQLVRQAQIKRLRAVKPCIPASLELVVQNNPKTKIKLRIYISWSLTKPITANADRAFKLSIERATVQDTLHTR
jgi:hypothetical protein